MINIKEDLENGVEFTTVQEIEKVQDFLKSEGYIEVISVNQFGNSPVKSRVNKYKELYHSEDNNEIKLIRYETSGADKLLIKQLSLQDVQLLSEENPLKIALNLLNSDDFKNKLINLEEIKSFSLNNNLETKPAKLKM